MPKHYLPLFVAPMQASSGKKPFDSPDWIFETKLDGYRAIAVIDSTGKARIWLRNHLTLETKFPTVRKAVVQLHLRSTILDGEVVALDHEGIPPVSIAPTKGMRETIERLKPLFSDKPPVENPSKIPEKIQWVKPKLVCEVAFAEWTEDEQLRQTSFLGWRDDKRPEEAVLELQ
jgi:ATP-dependent DNA ligase